MGDVELTSGNFNFRFRRYDPKIRNPGENLRKVKIMIPLDISCPDAFPAKIREGFKKSGIPAKETRLVSDEEVENVSGENEVIAWVKFLAHQGEE